MFLRPPAADERRAVYEFFAPFAHVPGRFEWCRIRSPTHGVFDTFILLDPRGTQHAADVYVNSAAGTAFMRDRYPECRTHRVPARALAIAESRDGRTVRGVLSDSAGGGPLRSARMTLRGATGVPKQEPYGGTGGPVWGGRFTCWGVDLNMPATLTGRVVWRDGTVEPVGGAGIVTAGSFGRLAPVAVGRARHRPAGRDGAVA